MVLKSPLERTQAFSTPRKPTVEIPASNVEDALKYIKENASGGLASVEDDPAPKLGGDLDLNGHQIVGLATVATSGSYSDLTGKPTLGTAAAQDVGYFATAAQGTKADSALQSTDVAPTIHAATGKSTPVDADELGLVDSAASNVLKKLTWANLKATLKTYLDTLYQTKLTSTPRELLTGNRTYYVRTDGSDSNTGLVNNSGGAFATIQKAVDVAASLDGSIYDVTIQLGVAGTYPGALLKHFVGAGTLNIIGNSANPSNYTITKNGVYAFSVSNAGAYKLSGLKVDDATSSNLISCGAPGADVTLDNIDYGNTTNYAIVVENASIIRLSGANNKISAATLTAFFVTQSLGQISSAAAPTFTLQNNLTVTRFMYARWMGFAFMPGITFNLNGFSVTGARYNINDNSVVITGGAGGSYFPGSSAGSTSTGGQYI